MATAQSLIKLLDHWNFKADLCERRIPHSFITKDLFGVFDLIGFGCGINGAVGIQLTSQANLNSRVRKVFKNDLAGEWIDNGNAIWIAGYGGTKNYWRIRVLIPDRDFSFEVTDFSEAIKATREKYSPEVEKWTRLKPHPAQEIISSQKVAQET